MDFSQFVRVTFPVAALLAATACHSGPDPRAKKESGPPAVRVAKVQTRSVLRSVDGVGTLFPLEEAVISAEVDGRLENVKADLGDSVMAGQVLARISDEEQRYMVAQQEAQLRQSLVRVGLKNENEKLTDITTAPDVRRAQADVFDAETRYRRTRELVAQGIGPKSDLDQAQARYQSAQAAYDVTVNQTRNLLQEIERVKAVLDLQRKKLRDTSVRAPFAAYVKDRQAVAGAYVRTNSPLFTLVKIDPIRLRIEVPERMSPWVKNGQKVDVTMEAFADRRFEGRVWRISPTVDQTKRTFIVEALIQNPRQELKPGSYARAHLLTDKNDSIRVVPSRAVQYVLGTNKSFVIKADGSVDVREVKIGDRFPNEYEILEGLNEGETVAVSGLSRLDAGMKVRVQSGN